MSIYSVSSPVGLPSASLIEARDRFGSDYNRVFCDSRFSTANQVLPPQRVELHPSSHQIVLDGDVELLADLRDHLDRLEEEENVHFQQADVNGPGKPNYLADLGLSVSVAEWRRRDLNPQPPPCKGGALPVELRPRL